LTNFPEAKSWNFPSGPQKASFFSLLFPPFRLEGRDFQGSWAVNLELFSDREVGSLAGVEVELRSVWLLFFPCPGGSLACKASSSDLTRLPPLLWEKL